MSVSLYTTSVSNRSSSPASCKEIGRGVAELLPEGTVTVAKVGEATFGFFSTEPLQEITPHTLIEAMKRLAPSGVVVAFNYKEASEEELRSLFLNPDETSDTVKFKGFKYLSPSFMKELALARPHLTSIDLRNTQETKALIEAYLDTQKETVEGKSSSTRGTIRELLSKQQRILEQKEEKREALQEILKQLKEKEEEIKKIEVLEATISETPIASPLLLSEIFQKVKLSKETLLAELSLLNEKKTLIERTLGELDADLKKIQNEQVSCRQGFFDLESETTKFKVSRLSPEEKKELEKNYPNSAFIDGETHLDLSGTGLTLNQIIKKIEVQPHLKSVDLSQIPGLDLFSLYNLEKERGLTLACSLPDSFTVPKQLDRKITVVEIESFLNRFPLKGLDVRYIKTLSALDVLYLEASFPSVELLSNPPQECTVTYFDERIIERLLTRFPKLTIELVHPSLKDEELLIELLDDYPDVEFKNSERIAQILQSTTLLKFYLKRALKECKTNLSLADLDSLAIQSPALAPTVEKVIQLRKGEGDQSPLNLRKEISGLSIEKKAVVKTNFERAISYSLGSLIKKYGTETSRLFLESLECKLVSLEAKEEAMRLETVNNLTSYEKSHALFNAAGEGNIKVVELLLSKGAKVDAACNDGCQPLHLAALLGHKEVAELLLSKGAKVDAAYNDGVQPLHLAAQNGHKEVAELLLSKGAKVDAVNNDGVQPLHFAALNGHKEVAELLLSKGANVYAVNYDYGVQPLHFAAQNGHKEVAELLLSKGAKVDAVNNYGVQPLQLAAQNGHKEVAELLLSKGAKVDAVNKYGTQPLHFAAQNGHKEVAKLLLSKGANVDAVNNNGVQPLHLAAQNGHEEVAKFLSLQRCSGFVF